MSGSLKFFNGSSNIPVSSALLPFLFRKQRKHLKLHLLKLKDENNLFMALSVKKMECSGVLSLVWPEERSLWKPKNCMDSGAPSLTKASAKGLLKAKMSPRRFSQYEALPHYDHFNDNVPFAVTFTLRPFSGAKHEEIHFIFDFEGWGKKTNNANLLILVPPFL